LPFPRKPLYKPFGAIHGTEIAYVFGNLESAHVSYSSEDRALSRLLMAYWTNFVKSGNPNGTGLPRWPAFNERQQLAMCFRRTAKPCVLPNLKNLKLLDQYYAERREKLRGKCSAQWSRN